MNKFSTALLFTFTAYTLSAQQLPQYSTWLLNPYGYNPACAGLEQSLVANGVYRQQWIDLDGAPVTQQVNAHLPVYIINSGVGIRLENDAIGPHRTSQAMLSYNYQQEIGKNGLLSIGGGGGYQQYVLDGSRLRTPQGDYDNNGLQHNDLYLPLGKISVGIPIFELGVSFSTEKLLIGAASLPVFAPIIKERSPGRFNLQPERHYVLHGNYQFKFGDYLALTPGVLLKSDLVATQAELASMAVWKDKFIAGISYRGFSARSKDAVVIMAGLAVNEKTTVVYAYDIPVSGLQNTNRGSHELMLRYNFNKPIGAGKLPPIIYNPRFLN